MNALLRQHRYALTVAVRRLVAQPFSSLSNLLVMALALAVPLLGAALLLSAQPVARQLAVTPELTVFLDMKADTRQAAALAQRIESEFSDAVAGTREVPRGQALSQLRENPAWEQALKVLEDNPLPDAVVVTLAEGEGLAAQAQSMAQTIQGWDHVDAVQLDTDWVRRLEALLRFARFGLMLLGAGVAVVVLATVFNTVRMQALSQREEIGVARLVGATEAFVRRPFLYLGMLTSGLSALAAIGLAALALRPLNDALANVARSYGAEFALRLPAGDSLLLAVMLTALLGALSARWSVTRSTRF